MSFDYHKPHNESPQKTDESKTVPFYACLEIYATTILRFFDLSHSRDKKAGKRNTTHIEKVASVGQFVSDRLTNHLASLQLGHNLKLAKTEAT